MKSPVNAVIAGCAGLAMFCLVGCSTTHHVTETTRRESTTRQTPSHYRSHCRL